MTPGPCCLSPRCTCQCRDPGPTVVLCSRMQHTHQPSHPPTNPPTHGAAGPRRLGGTGFGTLGGHSGSGLDTKLKVGQEGRPLGPAPVAHVARPHQPSSCDRTRSCLCASTCHSAPAGEGRACLRRWVAHWEWEQRLQATGTGTVEAHRHNDLWPRSPNGYLAHAHAPTSDLASTLYSTCV